MDQQGFLNRPMSIALDAVRGLAALVVLVGHAVQQDIYTGPWPFSDLFQLNAVSVFFVLSGLVIANSVFTRPASLGDYVIARAARVLPVAWFALAFSLAAWALGQALDLSVVPHKDVYAQPSLAALLLPLVFMSEGLFSAGPVWNPPFWSLTYEVWYYALFGVAWYTRGWLRAALLVLMVPLAGFKVLLLLPVWLLGVALAKYAPADGGRGRFSGPVLIAAALALATVTVQFPLHAVDLMMYVTGQPPQVFGFSVYAFYDLFFAAAVALAFLGMRQVADDHAALLERFAGPIRWLAECSFTLYLIHWPLMNLLGGLGIVAGSNPLLWVLIMAGIVALSGQIAKLTEHRRPQLRRWLARQFQGRGRLSSADDGAQVRA